MTWVWCHVQLTANWLAESSTLLCGAGVATAIGAMSAPAWEIRNSASLAFTALLMRTVGFKNVTKVQCATYPADCAMVLRMVCNVL